MKYTIPFILVLFSYTIFSQDYVSAVGIRTGRNPGFIYKRFLSYENAYEWILSFKNEIKVTAVKESYRIAFKDFSNRIFYYYGFGGHLGFISRNNDNFSLAQDTGKFRENLAHPIAGLDVMIGLEYRFISVPFVAAFEIQPYFNIFGESFFNMYSGDLSLSVKYIIE